ncbi:MAG TPA: hypothetical protein VII53_02300 [Solirubrobacteraceae bacterium]
MAIGPEYQGLRGPSDTTAANPYRITVRYWLRQRRRPPEPEELE